MHRYHAQAIAEKAFCQSGTLHYRKTAIFVSSYRHYGETFNVQDRLASSSGFIKLNIANALLNREGDSS
jgi:hypothetical protein